MNRLHLAAIAAQHTAGKIQFSGSETADIRIAGGVAIAGCLFGMYRTVRNERAKREAAAVEQAARTQHGLQLGREWLAANTTDGAD